MRKSKKNVEGEKIVTGKPLFGLDYRADGMLIAMIQHPPAFGMKLKSFDASQTLKMPGIKDVFSLKLYEDGFEQGGFDTRTFNELLVVVGKTHLGGDECPQKAESAVGTYRRYQRYHGRPGWKTGGYCSG